MRKHAVFTGIILLTLNLFLPISSFLLDLERLSEEQSASIADLRELVKDEVTEEYMTEDYYLAKWFNNKDDLDVQDAHQLFRQNVQWREQQNITTILDEDWAEMHARFPYSRNTVDKMGRPLLYIDFSRWDVSKFLAEGGSSADRYKRYMTKMHEDSAAHVRELRKKGKNVTQYNLIFNAIGYSVTKHACFQCLYLYRDVGISLTPFYSKDIDRPVFVNVPYLAKIAYLFLSEENKSKIRIYGQDKDQWKAMLLEYVDPDQFPEGILEQQEEKDNSEGFMNWNQEL